MYMLDTNILIYAMKHPRDNIIRKILKHSAIDLCISIVTYAELLIGVEKSLYSDKNLDMLTHFLYGIQILDFDQEAARQAQG